MEGRKGEKRVKNKKIERKAKEFKNLKRKLKTSCNECGSWRNLTIHHIIPKSRGGLNHRSNLICLCADCHKKEHVISGSNWGNLLSILGIDLLPIKLKIRGRREINKLKKNI